MTSRAFYLVCSCLLLAGCGGPKPGPSVPDITFESWQVMTTKANGGLCYAFSTPQATEGTLAGKRDTTYLMVTRRGSGKIEVSVAEGFPMDTAYGVELDTGKKQVSLGARGAMAWARSDKQDKEVLAALQKADSVAVSAKSAKGEEITDTYSLEGFSQALSRIKALCP